MAKSFYTTGTGNEQTLTPIINERVPIYDTVADAEADLANLEVGQIVKTKDAGLVANLNPIDEVKQGVFLPPTSNAVAECLKYSSAETFTGIVWIDGNGVEHKIYRRVYYSATNWSNNTIIDTISDIAVVFKLDSITMTSGNQWHPIFNGGNVSNYAVINLNGSIAVTRTDTFANSKPSVVIVEYTKTTD